MLLRPCTSCRRHVREHEPCPFCGAAGAPARSPVTLPGRLGRAAVFASATLVGCSSTPAPQHVTSPPPDDQHAMVVDPPPADAGTQTFAAPPPDAAAPVGTAVIRGTVRFENAGPYALRSVTLVGAGGTRQAVRTDAKGRYEIRDIPAGTYQVVLEQYQPNQGHQAPPPAPMRAVVVADGETQQVDFTLPPYVAPVRVRDEGPCCKPYGAPPARRRVV